MSWRPSCRVTSGLATRPDRMHACHRLSAMQTIRRRRASGSDRRPSVRRSVTSAAAVARSQPPTSRQVRILPSAAERATRHTQRAGDSHISTVRRACIYLYIPAMHDPRRQTPLFRFIVNLLWTCRTTSCMYKKHATNRTDGVGAYLRFVRRVGSTAGREPPPPHTHTHTCASHVTVEFYTKLPKRTSYESANCMFFFHTRKRTK